MCSAAENPPPPRSRGNSVWQSAVRFSLWCVLALLGGVAIGWLSIKIQSAGLAPLILFSLMVGVASGGLLVLLSRGLGCGQKRSMLIASIGLGLCVALMQHVFAYQAYYASYQASIENNPKAVLAKTLSPEVGPSGLWNYMRAESRKSGYVWMWSIDAVMIVFVTVGMVWLGNRNPYCDVCHRWYRARREAGIPGKLFSRVQSITGIEIPSDATLAKYRLFHCLRGCGPARVKLSWVSATGKAEEKFVWLDASERTAWEEAF